MPLIYDPLNWYWTVNSDTQGRVYSSKLGDYVPISDATYQAWLASGGVASSVNAEVEIGVLLASQYPGVTRPVPAAILDGYQQEQSDDIFRHKLIKFLFNLNNDVRVLKGQQPLTVAQARAAMKGQM